MKTLPTLFVGLGATGIRTLNQAALFIPQAYGIEGLHTVGLLGFGFDKHIELQDNVQHCLISAETGARLNDKVAIRDDILLSQWLDIDYYAGAGRSNHHNTVSERQMGRLMFLEVLRRSPDLILDVIKRQVSIVTNTSNDKIPVIHIFASLDDTESNSILLDIISLIDHVFHEIAHQKRLVLHLALPSVVEQPITDQTRTALARCFAVMREIQRFLARDDWLTYVIYPPDSCLGAYNPAFGSPIDAMKTYEPAPPDTLSARWIDAMLPLLDPSQSALGTAYQQHNLVNWHSTELSRRSEQDSTLAEPMTGTYLTRAVILPLQVIQSHWTRRLAHDVVANWIGQPLGEAESFERIQRDWLLDTHDVRCPHIAYWAVTMTQQSYNLQTTPHNELEKILFSGEKNNPHLNSLRAEYAGLLDWQPDFAHTYNQTPSITTREFMNVIVSELTENLGPLDLVQADVSAYAQTLTHFIDDAVDRFQKSLMRWLGDAVNDKHYGVRQLDGLLWTIQSRLATLESYLKDVVWRLRRQIENEDFEDEIMRSGRRIVNFKTLFGRTTTELENFMRHAQRISSELKRWYLLEAIYKTIKQLNRIIQQPLSAISRWSGSLWAAAEDANERTMLARLQRLANHPLNVESVPDRYWLSDASWIETRYRLIADAEFDQLRASLAWTWDTTSELSLWLTEPGESTGSSLKANPAVRLSYKQEAVNHNLDQWLAHVEQSVRSYDLSVADYLRTAPDSRQIKETIRDFLTARAPQEFYDAAITQHMLLCPQNMSELPDNRFVNELETYFARSDMPLTYTYYGTDNTRLTRHIAYEAFLMMRMPTYAKTRQAYIDLDARQKLRLHVIPAEVEATRYELQARKRLGHEIFSGNVIALFSRDERMRLFVWLEALQLVRLHAYTVDENRYVLQLTDENGQQEIWWLTGKQNANSRLNAANAIVLSDKPLPYGDLEVQITRSLPSVERLQQQIDHTIEKHSKQRRDYPQKALLWRLVQKHQHNPHRLDWARITAEAAEIAMTYADEMWDCWRNTPETGTLEERNVCAALALIAQKLYDEKLNILRSRIH